MYYLSCVQSSSARQFDKKREHTHMTRTYSWRWMRLAVLVGLILICFMFGAMVNTVADTGSSMDVESGLLITSSSDRIEEKVYIDVMEGDTLWGIAAIHAPDHEDIRKYIDRIKKVNQLETSVLKIGQVLELP